MNFRLLLAAIPLLVLLGTTGCPDKDSDGDDLPPCIGDSCEIPPDGLQPLYYDQPAWHPGGIWIAAIHGDSIDSNSDGIKDSVLGGIWLIHSQTGAKKHLISGYTLPSWSPDGGKLAMVRGGNIYTITVNSLDPPLADTNSLLQLTTTGGNFFPDWSPDGQKIVYDSKDDSPNGMNFIWIMNTDGTGKKRIAYEPMSGEIRIPSWANQSYRIAHVRYSPTYFSTEVFVMDSAGGDTTRITFNNSSDRDPKFSPNDSLIAFYSQSFDSRLSLQTIRSDGTNIFTLVDSFAISFDWSPDGEELVFVFLDYTKERPGNGHLWLVDVNGSNPRQLTQ